MSANDYKVVYKGSVLEGFEQDQVARSLQAEFKISDKGMERFSSGKAFTIKGNLAEEDAYRLHAQLSRLGMDVTVAKTEEEKLSLEQDPDFTPAAKQASYEKPQLDTSSVAKKSDGSGGAFCRSCGVSVIANAVICPKCGAAQDTGTRKSRAIAALLAFFLGGIGAHRLYLGQWWGLIYIPFYFIMGFVAWIEAIVFVCTSKEKWDAKYGDVKGSGAAVVVAIVVCIFGGVAMLGILAAIALPAYQDYTVRAKMTVAFNEIEPYKDSVEEFITRTNFIPNQNIDAGLPDEISTETIKSLQIAEGGNMVVTFQNISTDVDGKYVAFIPAITNGSVAWTCQQGTVRPQYLPAFCRSGDTLSENSSTSDGDRILFSSDGLSQITVPDNWEVLPELNDVASIEAGNEFKETYVIVISDYKEDLPGSSLFDFGDLVMANMEVTDFETGSVTQINNMPAMSYRFSMIFDGVKLKFILTVFEGNQNFYQVMAWTSSSRWNRNESLFEQITESFAEQN